MGSLGSRISATIITGVCWLAFALLYLAFYASSFDFWQNIAIMLVSMLVTIGVIAVVWIRWIIR